MLKPGTSCRGEFGATLQRVDPTVPARGLKRWFPNISFTLTGHASTNDVTVSPQTRPQGEPPPEIAGQVRGDPGGKMT